MDEWGQIDKCSRCSVIFWECCSGFQCLHARLEIINVNVPKLQQSNVCRFFFPIWNFIKISFWNKSLETLSSVSHASLLGWQPASRTAVIRDSQLVCESEGKRYCFSTLGRACHVRGFSDYRIDCLHDFFRSTLSHFGQVVTFSLGFNKTEQFSKYFCFSLHSR